MYFIPVVGWIANLQRSSFANFLKTAIDKKLKVIIFSTQSAGLNPVSQLNPLKPQLFDKCI